MDTECLEDTILQNLRELIIDQLHTSLKQVEEDTPLFDLSMDSIDAVELTLEIKEVFDVEISDGILGVIRNDEEMTVGKLSEVIVELINERNLIAKKVVR